MDQKYITGLFLPACFLSPTGRWDIWDKSKHDRQMFSSTQTLTDKCESYYCGQPTSFHVLTCLSFSNSCFLSHTQKNIVFNFYHAQKKIIHVFKTEKNVLFIRQNLERHVMTGLIFKEMEHEFFFSFKSWKLLPDQYIQSLGNF